MHTLKIISLILLLTVYCDNAIAADRPTRFDKPEDVVAWLYRDFGWQAYVGQYFDEIVNDQPKNILQRYFTPQLAALIMKERKFEIETQQVGPANFDLLFGSQDPDGISNIRINRQPGTNIVSVLYDQNTIRDVMKIDFQVVKTQNGWRISNIHYQQAGSFAVWLLDVLSGPY